MWFRLCLSTWCIAVSLANNRPTTTCHCFSTCDLVSTADFLSRIPVTINDVTSPWHGYLQAVYPDITLPFNLSNLNFFYHHDNHWKVNHPHVEWPMASCQLDAEWLANSPILSGRTKITETTSTCPTQSCLRWYSNEKTASMTNIALSHLQNYDNTTRGSAFFYDKRPYLNSGAQKLEVIRMYKAREGHEYGYWFFHAVGSGIFMDLNRTKTIHDKTSFAASAHRRHRKADYYVATVGRKHDLDSVYMKTSTTKFSEVTAWNNVLHFPTSGCAPFEFYAGSNGQLSCLCDTDDAVLNCNQIHAGIMWASVTKSSIPQKGKLSGIQETIRSTAQLNRVMNPRFPTCLFANNESLGYLKATNNLHHWNHIKLIDENRYVAGLDIVHKWNRESATLLKLYAFLQSPFKKTLFLDSDVYLLQPTLPQSLLHHTLQLADYAAPFDPAHTNPPALHAPVLCSCLVAFETNNATQQLFRHAAYRMIDVSRGVQRSPFRRNGDQEAIYLEWITGRYNVRMFALPEEYYCPQVVRNVRNSPQQQYTWSTSWTNMGKLSPYRCKTVHGHNYPEFDRRLTQRL